jgi:UDP-2,4-diacetamido-2,4,6-trideoxy-beta-L-altropyranose hydrolase
MNVIFRVDAGKTLGMGHLNRCLSIANQLKQTKHESIFVIKNKITLEKIQEFGFETIIMSKNEKEWLFLKKISKEKKSKIIIFDSKRKSLEIVTKKLKRYLKIVIIDNIKYSKFSDLLILPEINEQFKIIPKKAISGIDYILLNPNFRKIVKNREREILITIGSTDKADITTKIIKGFLKNKKKFRVNVIIGPYFSNEEKIIQLLRNDKRFKIIKNPNNIYELFATYCLGIVSYGITVYEAATQQLPIFVISHSNENSKSAKNFETYGCSKFVGKFNEIDYKKLADNIIRVSKNSQILEKMSESSKLFDGKGAERAMIKIIELTKK